MCFIDYDNMIKAFSTYRSDHPLDMDSATEIFELSQLGSSPLTGPVE